MASGQCFLMPVSRFSSFTIRSLQCSRVMIIVVSPTARPLCVPGGTEGDRPGCAEDRSAGK